MSAPKQSLFRLYSMGIAAENYDITNNPGTLEVTPHEEQHFLDGEINTNPTDDTVTGQDASGNTTQTKVTQDNSVTAVWLPNGDNRLTPPCIRRGERVYLYKFANLPDFFWSTTGMDHKYRKLETVVYGWNGTQDENDTSIGTDNHYYVEVSTHKGTITLQTSKANGEQTAHTVQFNPKEGKLIVQDDMGQSVYIDSLAHLIHLVNADASEVTLSQQDITVKCSDTLNLESDKTMNLQTETLNVKATTINVNATDVEIQAENSIKGSAQIVELDAPTIILGGVKITGGVVACNGINSTGLITCVGVESSAPIHAPNIN